MRSPCKQQHLRQSTSQLRTPRTSSCPCWQQTYQQRSSARRRYTIKHNHSRAQPLQKLPKRASYISWYQTFVIPCIGWRLWSQHHGCTFPQHMLHKRHWTWTQCWCCTCLPGIPCRQQPTWSRSDHCRCQWGTINMLRWRWRRCCCCTSPRDMPCRRQWR